MKLLIAALFVLGSTVALASPFAAPASDASLFKALKAGSTAKEDCEDFSGDWEGACTDREGTVRNETMTIIQNGCQYIKFDDEQSYTIGGLRTEAESSANSAFHFTMATSWAKDRQWLTADFTMTGRGFSETFPYTFKGTGAAHLFMKDASLASKSEFTTIMNLGGEVTEENQEETCLYERVSGLPVQ